MCIFLFHKKFHEYNFYCQYISLYGHDRASLAFLKLGSQVLSSLGGGEESNDEHFNAYLATQPPTQTHSWHY